MGLAGECDKHRLSYVLGHGVVVDLSERCRIDQAGMTFDHDAEGILIVIPRVGAEALEVIHADSGFTPVILPVRRAAGQKCGEGEHRARTGDE